MNNWNAFKKSAANTAVLTSLAVGLSMGLAATAQADGWPSSVTGSWAIVANQSKSTLVLTQGSAGAGSLCQPISGTAFGDTVQGFYCPASGRIAFKRGTALQTYSGNLAQSGTTMRMGGTWLSLGGSFGEYSFYATK